MRAQQLRGHVEERRHQPSHRVRVRQARIATRGHGAALHHPARARAARQVGWRALIAEERNAKARRRKERKETAKGTQIISRTLSCAVPRTGDAVSSAFALRSLTPSRLCVEAVLSRRN